MGLSSRSDAGVNREHWKVIIESMTRLLAEARYWFFQECVSAADRWAGNRGPTVVNREIGGLAAVSLKAYQIAVAWPYIERNGYIAESEMNDFIRLLSASICGDQTEQCFSYIVDYTPEETRDPGMMLVTHVLEYVQDTEDVDITAVFGLRSAETKFFADIQIIVSLCFAHTKKAKQLLAHYDTTLRELAQSTQERLREFAKMVGHP